MDDRVVLQAALAGLCPAGHGPMEVLSITTAVCQAPGCHWRKGARLSRALSWAAYVQEAGRNYGRRLPDEQAA